MTPKTKTFPPKLTPLLLPEVVTCVRCNAHYPRTFTRVCLTCGGELRHGLAQHPRFCYIVDGVDRSTVGLFARRA